ncbi:hypothetical protein KL86DYS1_10611 [uncultured Dysgonomonas sp.]|uniref:Uncharacterized protein n=1 Tax=uncultured Dysgonomonas sp. TaxID=206096 RepID=A0A212IZ17_9BACT|nr:hypothetical protein KL86DYS1_10611 [uncultured Dysgonomonas sp.]
MGIKTGGHLISKSYKETYLFNKIKTDETIFKNYQFTLSLQCLIIKS